MQILFFFFPLISLLLFVGLMRWILLSPAQPVRILPGVRIQGLVHRNRQQWMESLAKTVAREFNPLPQLEKSLTRPENFDSIKPVIEAHMDDFLRNRLKDQMPMISMFIGDKTIASLKTIFINEIEQLFPRVIAGFSTNLQKDLDLEALIFNKLEQIPAADIQQRLSAALKMPFRRLYLLAVLLGLLLAGLQAVLFFTLV